MVIDLSAAFMALIVPKHPFSGQQRKRRCHQSTRSMQRDRKIANLFCHCPPLHLELNEPHRIIPGQMLCKCIHASVLIRLFPGFQI
jgi:hypothetical protein